MKTASSFPCKVIERADVGIIMPDGCRLSARVWMPDDASRRPVPAIVEHLPYRKRDGTIARDELMHPWFAGHGYACLRIDMRGNGDSEGLMEDEYTNQEWQDACVVIGWAASQPWCNGRVGMMGISWGGFNSLQVAAMRPPELKAIITVCSSVDRFGDDIHFKGGCLLTENVGWAANMLSYSSRPPDRALVGERWRTMWMNRLENLPFLASVWHRHQRRDAYWKRGSVSEDYAAIEAAVLAVGGWHDGYRNTVSHLVSNLESPVKGIVGPWIHKYPHYAAPQPAIGFLQEARRWWDHWLKNIDTGVQEDPAYRVWLMDSIPPARWLPERPGRWIAETNWPSPSLVERRFQLDGHNVLRDITDATVRVSGACKADSRDAVPTDTPLNCITSPQDCGLACGEYFPFMSGPELPDEQSCDDAGSAVFDSAVLASSLAIIGAPVLEIRAVADQASGLVCIRLCDIRPDGRSALITMGLLNLTHRDGSENPQPVIPGQMMSLTMVMDQTAYRIAAGHRLRISVSTSYWPFVWPSPHCIKLALFDGELALQTRPPADDVVRFEPPEASPAWNADVLRVASSTRETLRDPHSGVVTTLISNDFGENRDCAHGLLSGSCTRERWCIHPDDPLSANACIAWQQTGGRDQWRWSTDVQVRMHCTEQAFHINATLTACEAGVEVFSRTYTDVIEREFV